MMNDNLTIRALFCRSLILLIATLVLVAQPTHAQKYKLVEVGPLPSNAASTIALINNDYGHVGGIWITATGEYRGFLSRPNANLNGVNPFVDLGAISEDKIALFDD